jgi:hypothetical protein
MNDITDYQIPLESFGFILSSSTSFEKDDYEASLNDDDMLVIIDKTMYTEYTILSVDTCIVDVTVTDDCSSFTYTVSSIEQAIDSIIGGE